MSKSKKEEYERLKGLINQWNIDHYDIFELSQPNEDLEFHGVVRFFFQGAIGANVITKCIRVSSTATTREVIDVLIEKFRPDMRMLSQNKYALYEVHVNGEERRLADEEKPLYVQLNWGSDVREGRFLLRNEDHPTVRDPALGFDKSVLQQDQGGFKRRLSKREKKEIKKRERERGKEDVNGDESVANKLYEEAPETSFTRSISNPEAVMRRRRQQKLEKKLAEMNATDGGADSGGTLKIYGESLRPDVPYKTLFLSTADAASAVVKESLEKYGLEKEDMSDYCLVEVLLPSGGMEYHGETRGDERVLDDNECPLAIVIQHAKRRDQGHIIFQLRKRTADAMKRRQKQRSVSHEDLRAHPNDLRHTNLDMLPYLIEANVRGKPKRHVLPLNVTEVVNVTEVANNKPDYNGKHFLQLAGPDIRPRHCVIAHTEGIVTVTPNSQNAETYVEGQKIYETTMLKHGMTVQFGRDKVYKFLDPRFDDPAVKGQPYQLSNKAPRGQPQETNFDVDGHIETLKQPSPRPGTLSWESPQKRSTSSLKSLGPDDLLPASVEYGLDAEDRLIQASISEVKSKQLQFKLAPTYTLYMSVRHLLSPRSPVTHRAQLVTDFVNKTSKMIQRSIQDHHNDPSSLAFWMANSSEILHMFKQDRDIYGLSGMSQEMLAEAVQASFHHLVRCLQGDLQRVMPAFLDQSDTSDGDDEMGHRYNMGRPTLDDVLDTLSAAMTLLRRCRVNAALTIQLFSQLFHFINMWLFNILVTEPQLTLCTRTWGSRLKRRLGRVETWAEKQGLELAADCHLCRIIQAAHLLQAPKSSADDVTNISSTCFKLNSIQLERLLTRYIPELNEPPVSQTFVERVVSIAENMADELTRSDDRVVRLEEDSDLHLPFLLPEDGYSCDTIRGIPNGLPEFVKQLESTGLCRFVINSAASGSWTVYMGDEHLSIRTGDSPDLSLPSSPEIITISFNKVKGSMGLSIVAAIGEGQPEQGIYIKSVVEGGAAALDGRLQAGDQLVEVDGKSLVGVTQDKAAELMTKTGQVVKLKVAKRAVLYHNLGSLLTQASPTSQRAAQNRALGPNRTFSDEGPPPYDGRDPKPINGYGNPDKMRAPSSGNLTDPRSGGHIDPYNNRHDDPRSKSTSNLHVETNLDHGDVRPNMKPAQSVGVLHPSQVYGQRPDIRHNEYENQPRYPQAVVQPAKPQNIQHPSHGSQQSQRMSDRSSVSSRTSSNSNKEVRPLSAYYNPNMSKESQDLARPRSEDVGGKLKEWQESYEDPRGGNSRPTSGRHSPPYSNIGVQNREPPPQPIHNPPPKPTAHERLFNQPSTPQKVNSNAQSRQMNFFENTTPLQREPAPPFHQLQRPPNESDLKPKLATKPVVVPAKKNWPRVQHVDMPNVRVDNRQTQPHFFGNTPPSPQGAQPSSPHKALQPSLSQFDQRNVLNNQKNALNDQRNASNDQRNSFDKKSVQFDQRNAPNDQRNASFEQKNAAFDKKNAPFDQRNSLNQRNAPNDQRNAPNDQRNSLDQRNSSYDQRNAPKDQRSSLDSRNSSYDQRNAQNDQRNVPYDKGNMPNDQRNTPQQQQQDQRNQSQPDLRNDPRFAHDLRNAPDPRNGPALDFRSSQQDPRGISNLKNADPRIVDSSAQQAGARDNYSQRDSYPAQSSGRDSNLPQQNVQKVTNSLPASHFQEQKRAVPVDPYFASNQYGYSADPQDFPPPPAHKDLPPDIPAQHMDDYQEELPPLPPPPSHEALVEQRLAEEQLKLMQQINATNQFLASDPRRDRRYSPNTVQQQQLQPPQAQQLPPQAQQPYQPQQQQQRYQPQIQQPSINRVIPPGIDTTDSTPLGYQVVQDDYRPNESASFSNYQNINFASDVRASSGPESQAPPFHQPPTEYDSSTNPVVKPKGFQAKPTVPSSKPKLGDRSETNSRSPWDRDAKEKAQEEAKEELFRTRELEMADLESRPYLSPQDQERLRKLRMEHEFQRRVKEVAEKGEYEYEDANDDLARRSYNREGLIESLKNDLEKSQERMRQFELTQQRADASREQDRLQILERRLEAYEKEREEITQKKQDKRGREQQDKLRTQREQERKQNFQDKFEVEESRVHGGMQRDDDGLVHLRMDHSRPFLVGDDKLAFDSFNNMQGVSGHQLGPGTLGYLQYENISSQGSIDASGLAPPPPERKSSYDTFTHHQQRASFRGSNSIDFLPASAINSAGGGLPSALRNVQEPPPPAKKSVSFNTQMNTYKDRTPSHSVSSYKSPTGSLSSDQGFPPPPPPPLYSPDADVFEPSMHPLQNINITSPDNRRPDFAYGTSSNTPNVIGTQEIYRDPRSRIEAKIASQSTRGSTDRMSFRDKMKYFSHEDNIKLKPKASKTLMEIESQLNGQ